MEGQFTSHEPKKEANKGNVVIIVLTFFMAISLGANMYTYLLLKQSETNVAGLKDEISVINESLVKLQSSDNDLSKLQTRIEDISLDAYFSRLQHQIEGRIVTTDFVVEKISIAAAPPSKEEGNAILSSKIDLSMQPGSNANYLGQGKFGISDRELKSKVQDILDDIGSLYDRGTNLLYKDKGLLKWESGTHSVTIKNYDIGTFEKGKFTLKGE